MHTYTILVEFYNNMDRTVQVNTEADLNNCDGDMLASDIESCLQEQHSIDMGDVAHWEFV